MALVKQLIRALQAIHREIARWSVQRPGRSMRLVALAGVLVFLYALPEVQNVHDGLWAAWSLMLTGFVAIAPKGVYDGRLGQWTRKHSRLSSLLFGGFTCFLTTLVLSDVFVVRTSLLIGAGLGLVLGVLSLGDARNSRHSDEGLASEADDEP